MMNDLFSQQQPESYPEIVKYVPPVLTEEEIKFFKKHVQKKPLATRERRKNSFAHKPIDIHLTKEQFWQVWTKVGEIQYNHADKAHKQKYGCERTWETVSGWFAEKAVSEWTGLPWVPTVNNFFEFDVGNLQVRGSQIDTGHLLTHEEDNGDDLVVFMTNQNILDNRIRGWLWVSETKDYEKYWCELEYGRPCFGVPQWDLRPPGTLLPFLEGYS